MVQRATHYWRAANGLIAQYCAKRLIILFILIFYYYGDRATTVARRSVVADDRRSWLRWNDFHSRLVGALQDPSIANPRGRYGFVFGPIWPGHQPPDQLRCVAGRRRRRYPSAARTADGQRWVQAQADQSVEIALWTSSHAGKTLVSYLSLSTKSTVLCLFVCTSWNGGSERDTVRPYTRSASKIREGWLVCLLMIWSPVWSL